MSQKKKKKGRSVYTRRQYTAALTLIPHALVFEPDFPDKNLCVVLATYQILLLCRDKHVLHLFQSELTP